MHKLVYEVYCACIRPHWVGYCRAQTFKNWHTHVDVIHNTDEVLQINTGMLTHCNNNPEWLLMYIYFQMCTSRQLLNRVLAKASKYVEASGCSASARLFTPSPSYILKYEKHFQNVEGCRDGSAKNHTN